IIRKITRIDTNWVVTTIAGLGGSQGFVDGTNNAARFQFPAGIAVDTNGIIYVSDNGNGEIRRITPIGTNWVVSTWAGTLTRRGTSDGTGTNALFFDVQGLSVDNQGNLFVADVSNERIRQITSAAVVSTIAGGGGSSGGLNGTGSQARFNQPYGVAVDS